MGQGGSGFDGPDTIPEGVVISHGNTPPSHVEAGLGGGADFKLLASFFEPEAVQHGHGAVEAGLGFGLFRGNREIDDADGGSLSQAGQEESSNRAHW